MLFEEYKLKNVSLRNRVVMAPMTRNQSPGGIPTNEVISYYERRAKAEVGLIITEGVEVSHKASSAYPNVPRLDTKNARDGWKKVVDSIKSHNGAVIAQLWHCGGFRKLGMDPDPLVPGHTASGLVRPGKRVAHAMTSDDIKEAVGQGKGTTSAKREKNVDDDEKRYKTGKKKSRRTWKEKASVF